MRIAAPTNLKGTVQAYLAAALLVLLGLLGRWWLDPLLHDGLPFALFLIPVVLAAWRGGLGPSLFATALGLLAGFWFFIDPRYRFGVDAPTGWLAMGLFLCTSLLVCWYTDKLRRANQRLEANAARIQAQQQQLISEIDSRKRAEAARCESEQRYRLLSEAIPQLVWTALPNGQCDFVSSQWTQYTGQPMSEYLGDAWVKALHPEDRPAAQATWRDAIKNGVKPDCEFRMLGRDGVCRWFKSRAVPLRDPSGTIIKWFGTLTDITEIVLARESLARRQQELEALVAERTLEIDRLTNKLQGENLYLRERISGHNGHHRMVGQSLSIRSVLAQVEQVAPTDSTVLLLGETGTGKELLAASIHELSSRRTGTLVSVNCAAMPAPLVESELFGREKGAFTGALARQVGRFELADRSTIFLDEIGELSLEIQAKLLRVLETKQIERLGNPKPISVDVRIIAATNRDLEKEVAEGRFRPDLYYRLNVFPISVPPLRERREDIPLLVWAFIDEFAKTFNKNVESIAHESMEALQNYSWPGNIRELRNLLERAMIVARGPKLRVQVPAVHALPTAFTGRKLEDVEREHILNVLEKSGWRVRGAKGAAERLGLRPTTLEARMAKLGIRRPGVPSGV